MKKKEITGLNDIRYIGITLGGFNPDNVDYIYNKRLQYFYYQNSSQKEITGNDEGLKYDEQGNIINATFNKVYETGLQIPETTFIENELNRINKIDLTQLENSQKDLVRFYKQYLESKQQASEPQQSEKGKKDKKPPKKDTYLLNIGLKLATGELDEYLTFKENGEHTGKKNISYPELATKFNLDEMHLKCTLSDYNDQSNRSKNLLYNPEIIEKVLTRLKSEGKEPKEWFLNKFKK